MRERDRETERQKQIFKEPSMAMVKLKFSRYSPSISSRAFFILRTKFSQQRNTFISMICILPKPTKNERFSSNSLNGIQNLLKKILSFLLLLQSSKMRWRRTVTYLGFLVVFFRLLLCRLLGLFSIHHRRSKILHITSSTQTWAKDIKNFIQFFLNSTLHSRPKAHSRFVDDRPNTDIHTAYGGSGL